MPDESTPRGAFTELGSAGFSRFGGYVSEEWFPELQGTKAVKVYKEMRDNDPIVGAVLFAIKMLCRQASWTVEAAGNSSEDREAARFLASCLDDMEIPWQGTLSDVLEMLTFGWSFHEIVYKRRMGPSSDPTKNSKYNDGRIGWRKLPIRAQETLQDWVFAENGDVLAMRQLPPPDYRLREIPMTKGLLFRTENARGNPEGRSILRNAYKSWYFKKNIEIIEGIGIERDLAGLPVVWVPPNVTNPQTDEERQAYEAFKRMVTNIRRDQQEGMVMPLAYNQAGHKLYDLSLLSTGGRRQFDTSAIVQRYDTRITQSVMADFIMLGTEKVGSFALSSNKTHLFAVAIGTFLDVISDEINTKAIPQLFALNGFPADRLPKLKHGDIEDVDLEQLGQFIQRLTGSGMPLFPNPKLEKHLLEAAHLPSDGVHGGRRVMSPEEDEGREGDKNE